MAKKWIALNILLLVAAFGLARELYRQYEQFKPKNDSVKTEPVSVENLAAAKASPDDSDDTSTETPVSRDRDYSVISEKTLFSEMRGLEDLSSDIASQVVPPLNPKPVLVGTVMIDGQYAASVIDPAAQQGRNIQTIAPETKRIGDSYRGYQITSIEADQMVLENNGRKEVIALNRSARRQQAARPAAAASATRVVPIGSSGGKKSGGMTVTTATTTGRTVQTAPQNTAQQAQQTQQQTQQGQQRTAADRTGQASPNVDAAGAMQENTLIPGQAPPSKPQARPAQKPQPEIDASSMQGARQRVVRSPFGDITRPGIEQ